MATRQKQTQFEGMGGLKLQAQCWLPTQPPRAVLALVHGVAEHSGRYANLVAAMVAAQYGVWAFDLRGHGRSTGTRGHIGSWEEYRADLGRFLALIRREHQGCPVFLYGHSLGSLIVLDYVATEPKGLSGVVVSGLAIRPAGLAKPPLVTLARTLGTFWPTFGLPLKLDPAMLSRDPAAQAAYRQDPLILRKVTARWATETLAAAGRVEARVGQVALPLLMLHGAADRVNLAGGSTTYFDKVQLADKQILLYPGMEHELHNDVGHTKVLADVRKWLDGHVPAGR